MKKAIIIDSDSIIIQGNHRAMAAQELGAATVVERKPDTQHMAFYKIESMDGKVSEEIFGFAMGDENEARAKVKEAAAKLRENGWLLQPWAKWKRYLGDWKRVKVG